MEEEFVNPDDLTGEEFAADHTGQVHRWRDQLSAKARTLHNKYGKSSVEVALKDQPQGEEIVPALGIEKEAPQADVSSSGALPPSADSPRQ